MNPISPFTPQDYSLYPGITPFPTGDGAPWAGHNASQGVMVFVSREGVTVSYATSESKACLYRHDAKGLNLRDMLHLAHSIINAHHSRLDAAVLEVLGFRELP